ncbi:MAG: transcriptional regulator [Bacilli bacterium]|nr:transcriptional regulator [Bacilli bacterium]MBQ8901850.1 transcriptional regulator [Bacilli bacterium]
MIKRMKEIRQTSDKKQKEVAEYMGIKRSTYAVLENNHNIIPLKRLNDFANYFDVSLDYVFGITDIKQYKNSHQPIDREKTRQRIRQVRKENNYTQSKLAKFLNTSPSVWCDYERGRYLVSTTFIYQFAKKFNVSVDWLLGKID